MIPNPAEWLNEALSIAHSQPAVPDSPGSITNNSTNLCAAACIALAGLRLAAPDHASAFIRSYPKGEAVAAILQAFKMLGLSEGACISTMKQNDDTAPTERIGVIVSFFNGRIMDESRALSL